MNDSLLGDVGDDDLAELAAACNNQIEQTCMHTPCIHM